MVGADGQPQWPYDTRPWRADSPYSRGTLSGGQVKRGEDAGGILSGGQVWALVVARPMSTPISLFERYCEVARLPPVK